MAYNVWVDHSMDEDIAIDAEEDGFDFQFSQIGHSVAHGYYRCDVFSELCSPDLKPRRWATQLVTRFCVISRVAYHEDFEWVTGSQLRYNLPVLG